MQLFLNTTIDGLGMGLCFAVLALGVYISYTILDFPDLSVDGTFPLGGVVATILLYRTPLPPVAALLLAFLAGAAAGAITGLLHVKLKITPLLSAIIVMTALLSVTLALTQLLTDDGNTTTIFSYTAKSVPNLFDLGLHGQEAKLATVGVLFGILVLLKLAVDLFLGTRLGYMLRASGSNSRVVVALGRDAGNYKLLGLSLANGLSGLSGGIYAQYNASYDNTCGSGKVVLALASVIIGLALFSRLRFVKNTTAVAVGAIIYSLCLNYLVLVDENGIYLKLLNAILFALILVGNRQVSRLLGRLKTRPAKGGDGA